MSYFTEDLLELIKLRSMAPIAQTTFSNEKILSLADQETQLKLVSDLIKVKEDFFLTSETTSVIGNVQNYGIPSRAIGNALKTVSFRPTGQAMWIPLVRVDSERAQDYTPDLTGYPEKFYIMGDEVFLLPAPQSASGELKFEFPATPNALALTETCAKITSSSSSVSTASFMVSTDLTTSLFVGDYVDFLCVQSPFKLWAYRVPITQITSTQIDVALSSVVNEAGTILPQSSDYICPSGTTNIPQLPVAFHAVLAQMVVVRLMESLGDLNKFAAAKQTLQEMRADAGVLIKNRVEGSPEKIRSRHALGRYFR